jgi:hypothetical protein
MGYFGWAVAVVEPVELETREIYFGKVKIRDRS